MGTRFVDRTGTVGKSRRSKASGASYSPDDLKDPEKAAEVVTRLASRLATVEGQLPPDSVEFDVTCPAGGTVTIQHGFTGPVRWYVTSWRRNTNAGTYSLTELVDSSQTAIPKTLKLYSKVSGQAVIRVEAVQNGQSKTLNNTASEVVYTGTVPGSLGYLLESDGAGGIQALTTGSNGKWLTVSGGIPAWVSVGTDTQMLWSNAGDIASTSKLTVSHSTAEVTHTGKPNHSETRSEFHQADTYGVAWSQWGGCTTTDGTTGTKFNNPITIDAGYGDGYVTVTVEVTYAFVGAGEQGGNYMKKATFKRTGGVLSRVAIENFTKTTLQSGMIPSNFDITVTDNNTIDPTVTGLGGVGMYWTESVHVQMAYDPTPTGRVLFDFDFTTLDLGYMSAAAFLTRTGLTFTRTTVSTVQTSASSVIDGADINNPVVGNIGSTLSHRGLVIQGNTWNKLAGTAANGPRNISTGSPWSAGTTSTITYPTFSPNQSNFGGSQADIVSAGFSSFFNIGSDDTTDTSFTSWQNGVGNTGTSDMQQTDDNNASTLFIATVVTQTSTWSRINVHHTTSQGIKFFCPADARDMSGVGGQTARARHVGVDYVQIEDGPTPTEAIGVITATGGGRTKDLLSFSPGSTWIAANGQFKFYSKFCPKAASSTTTYWQTATGTRGNSAAWFLWTWGANGQNYAKFKDSDKKLYVKIANGTEKVSTNAISWAAGDQVEVYLAAGNNVASVAKYKINGGSWTDLILATMTDVPAPSSGAIRVFTDDNTASGDAGAMQSWLNRLTVYDTTAPSGV